MFPFVIFVSTLLAASMSETEEKTAYGKQGGKRGATGRRRREKKKEQETGGSSSGEDEEGTVQEEDPYERAKNRIDLEFDITQIGDDVADDMFSDEEFGVFPGPPTGAQVLRSAALAQPGSWTERNVLQAGAKDAWSRRISGGATEADYTVLRAARPGITSSRSGPISPAWSKSPWPGTGGSSTAGSSIEDAVLEEMGL